MWQILVGGAAAPILAPSSRPALPGPTTACCWLVCKDHSEFASDHLDALQDAEVFGGPIRNIGRTKTEIASCTARERVAVFLSENALGTGRDNSNGNPMALHSGGFEAPFDRFRVDRLWGGNRSGRLMAGFDRNSGAGGAANCAGMPVCRCCPQSSPGSSLRSFRDTQVITQIHSISSSADHAQRRIKPSAADLPRLPMIIAPSGGPAGWLCLASQWPGRHLLR